ncbi:MAG: hypothetical protein JSR27_11175 [Proteobacteria bacterium]|nr:hypothetical protein [Pseudomonadota bacterium]
MNMRLWIAVAAALAAVPAFAETPPDFSGEWVANDGRSASVDTAAPSHTPASHAGGRGMHGGGMGGGMHGGRSHRGGPSSGNTAVADAKANANPRRDAHMLVIRQSEVVFDIDADGQRMVYRFDNRRSNGTPAGSTVKLDWISPNMRIDTKPQGGGDIVEKYSMSPDGKKLILTMHVQSAGEDTAQEIDRVFVRAGAGDEPPTKGGPTLPP